MSATEITVIGNVVDSPRRVRTQGGSVTNFRLASTERRYDSAAQGFIDGNTFWVDVECWGDLGGNVSHSISKGDPVVVVGTISTHQWDSEQGRRSKPQIKAEAVAPNLAKGTAEFKRNAPRRSAESADDTTRDAPDETPAAPGGGFPAEVPLSGRDYVGLVEEAVDDLDTDLEPEPAHA